jgi:O-antigen/teichoic acid export membrane protein
MPMRYEQSGAASTTSREAVESSSVFDQGVWKRTSVRSNFSANVAGKVLSLLVSLACVPIYIRVLGIGGYGLIGVWTTLETIANLLDFGLSPTITREVAACSTRAGGAQDARDLVRTLEISYWLIGVAIGAVVVMGAAPIAHHWLRSSQLSANQVRTAVVLIGLLILCRWPLSFYSGGLTGLERQVVLSGTTTGFAFARSLGSVFVLIFVSPTVFAFFVWQIAINLVLTALLTILLWQCLPSGSTPRFRPELLGRIWRFAGGLSAVTLVSMVLSDLDKIVVSSMLPLEAFGYYTLATRIASSLATASGPLFAALFPAFARLVAAQDDQALIDLYHRSAQLMAVLILPMALTVVFFARPLIFAWTGNESLAGHVSLIAALLTAGTGFNCMVTVPWALQLAYGWTSLSFWYNLFAISITIPLLLYLTSHFGGAGAASVWLLVNASFLVVPLALMHRRILTTEARRLYIEDIGIPLLACSIAAAGMSALVGGTNSRLEAGLTVIFSAAVLQFIGLLTTPLVRRQLWQALSAQRLLFCN